MIRAFNKDAEFTARTYDLIDKNAVANQVTMGVWGWYNCRFLLLSSLVLMAGCAFCVVMRDNVDTVLLSLML